MIGQQEADIGVKVLETMEATQDSILTDFKETIKNKRYLIVLEDLSSIVQWNIIRTLMRDMKNSSRIVVSTQQHEIASLCTEQPNHEGLLRKFSPDHSVYALFKELPKRLQVNIINYILKIFQHVNG
jgi:PHP family Zn ribbon phosphoesterase